MWLLDPCALLLSWVKKNDTPSRVRHAPWLTSDPMKQGTSENPAVVAFVETSSLIRLTNAETKKKSVLALFDGLFATCSWFIAPDPYRNETPDSFR